MIGVAPVVNCAHTGPVMLKAGICFSRRVVHFFCISHHHKVSCVGEETHTFVDRLVKRKKINFIGLFNHDERLVESCNR